MSSSNEKFLKDRLLLNPTLKQRSLIIYALGIYEPDDPDKNPHVLSELAKASGGEAFFPESVRDVTPICERIAREIRNQYTISYVPTNQKQDGKYRAIHVLAESSNGSRLQVTTRLGYERPLNPAEANNDVKPEARN